MATGWYAELSRNFSLQLSPQLSFDGQPVSSVAITVSPSLGFSRAVRIARALPLTVSPALTMNGPIPANLTFSVSPQIGISAKARYSRTFGLTVSPQIGMSGTGAFFPYKFPFHLK